jgi:hypothetical protein
MRRKYTSGQIDYVRETASRGLICAEIAELFNARFGTLVSAAQIRALLTYHKIRNGHFRKSETGAEWVDKGYTKVKTALGKWASKHVLIWEEANGPVPEGCRITFADGNKRNFDLDNLICVSRQEWGAMISYKLYSGNAELTKLGLNLARLNMLINKRKREAAGHRKHPRT